MNEKKIIKVVVTGGAGFIGSHLVNGLVKTGKYDVHVIDDLSAEGSKERDLNPKAVLHEVGILDQYGVLYATKGAKYIFHLAAKPRVQYSIQEPLRTHDVNVNGTLNVLHAARKNGVRRVVFSSSSSVYGDQDRLPLVEVMTPNPQSPYALHKLIGEQYCKLWSDVYGVQTVCLRYFNVYGSGASPNGEYALVVSKFLDQLKNGKPLTVTGTGKHTRDFTHVSDVVRANILAATSGNVGQGEVFNIGAGKQVSILHLAKTISGSDTKIAFIPERPEPKYTEADFSRAKTILGWEPQVGLEQGIAMLKKECGLT